MKTEPKLKSIGAVGNHYGGLWVKSENGKYYWSIENWDGHEWEEIPATLYRALTKYEKSRKV